MSRRRRQRQQRLPQELVAATIESLTPEGRGLAHVDGKVCFIDFALPGEQVMFQYSKISNKYDEGRALEILKASPDRVDPVCPHFGICGGCSMQHMEQGAQIRAKQQALQGHLEHLAQTQPDHWLEPITGPVTGYRYKARLGVKYVAKMDKVLVGFREKARPHLADLNSCKVLHPSVGNRLLSLGELIMGMEARQTIPQIEVAVSDTGTCLVFRHLKPLSDSDRRQLMNYAQSEELQIQLQPAGPDSIVPLWPEQPGPLNYLLSNQNIKIEFQATDFTQVNPDINQKMLDSALAFLDLNASDKVLDLFCGLGNFTLPIAQQAASVIGVEAVESMVAKARDNAALNAIDNCTFYATDLSADLTGMPWLNQHYDKILLDPPRSGAMEMLK
ncbi:MAG: 23S rRNA (uracil(1939)-C(5))-methyltransferase RlmD, partial [Gammaproteobacteria bacterium]|nr:23S rRNA (uracil(1939)-C(5))-methyltransferase RlmD [Gammaproteobacteria bacterium]